MPRERDIRLDEYRISSNAYRELKYFCRQYGEKRAALSQQAFYSVSMPGERFQRDLKLIEDTVMEAAGPAMYRQLLLNVTEGVRYEYLGDAPCGRELFYKLRRRFFYLLYCRRS